MRPGYVLRKMPAGGYGVNGYTGRYQGPSEVPAEPETPCPWCRAGAWDDCEPRSHQRADGMCNSRVIAHNARKAARDAAAA